MKVIIDRFEGEFAVVEMPDKTFVNMKKNLFPPGVKEGDVISITIDTQKTEDRKKKINKLMGKLFDD